MALEPGEAAYTTDFYKGLNVKSAADCVFEGMKGVKDKETGKPGVLIEVKEIEIKGENAKVYGGYFAGAGVLYSLRLTKTGAAWNVIEKKLVVISDP